MFDTSQLDLPGLETKYKLPPGLLNAVMDTESAGNPSAVSPKGARGLFQFMPQTAQQYGINPDDPHQAADGAARMYADLSKQFNGSVPHMLAAYNWGSGNVNRHGLENAPPETQNYIQKIQAKLAGSQRGQINVTSPVVTSGGEYADVQAPPISFDDLPMENPQANSPPAPTAPISFDDLPMEKPATGPSTSPSLPQGQAKPPSDHLRALQIGAQGVGRGVADLAGMPVDLATAGINLAEKIPNLFGANLPPVTNPVGGGDWMARQAGNAMTAVGAPPIADQQMSTPERLEYNVNRFGTAAMSGGAGLADQAAKQAVSKFPSMADAWLQAYRADPTKAIAMDTVAGAGAGGGHTVAEKYAPDSPLAALAADALGGLTAAGGAHLAEGGVNSLQNFGRGLSEGFSIDKTLPRDPESGLPVARGAADKASRYLQDHANDMPAAQNTLAANADFYGQNKLPMPGTGALSNDVGLIGVERTARQADPTPFLNRDRAVREAQGDLVKNAVPQLPEGEKGLAQTFAQQTADQLRADAQGTAATAQSKLLEGKAQLAAAKQAETEMVAPIAAARGAESQASAQLDQAVNEGALQPRTKAKNAAFEAIDPKGSIQRDATPLLKTARAIKAQVGRLSPESSGVPAEFMQKLEALAPEETPTQSGLLDETGAPLTKTVNTGGSGTVPLNDLLDVRKYLATAAEKAQQGGNFDLANNVRTLKGQINDELDKVIQEGGPGSQEAIQAKQAYENEYAPYFAQGFGRLFRDKIQKDPTGRTALPPSATADLFLKSSPEAAKDLSRIASIAKDPAAAEEAVGNYMKAQMAQLVKSDGTMEPATTRKWLDNNRDTLSAFPAVQQQLEGVYKDVLNGRQATNAWGQQVQKLAADSKAADGGMGATERRINDSVLSTLIKNNPQNAAARILADGDPQARMKETLDLIGKNDSAKAAFKRAVADHLESQFTGSRTELTSGEDYAVLQSKLESYLKKPGVEAALADLYADTPNAMNSVKIAQRIGRDLAKVNIQAVAGSATAENKARMDTFLGPIELVFKSVFGNLEGGGQMRRLKLAMQTIPGLSSADAVQRLVVRAQLEPDLALQLYGRDASKMPPALWTKKLNSLLGYADASRTGSNTEDRKDQGPNAGSTDTPKRGIPVIDIYRSKK